MSKFIKVEDADHKWIKVESAKREVSMAKLVSEMKKVYVQNSK